MNLHIRTGRWLWLTTLGLATVSFVAITAGTAGLVSRLVVRHLTMLSEAATRIGDGGVGSLSTGRVVTGALSVDRTQATGLRW